MASPHRHCGILWTLLFILSISVYVGVQAATTTTESPTTEEPITTAPPDTNSSTNEAETTENTGESATTEPPTTEPPTTELPTTTEEPITTAPPKASTPQAETTENTSESATTEPPTTEELNTTASPDSMASTPQAETTENTSESATTEPPTTEHPTTEPPTTEPPTTEPPTTTVPTTTDVNECDAQPCVNGTCEDEVGNYTCTCDPGFEGRNCDHDINECDAQPCVNGTCRNEVGNYTCECQPGFEGRNCDQDIKECATKPCKNGGVCTELINGYKCSCQKGWQGVNCTEDIDECKGSYECRENSICNNTQGGYECPCKDDYMENEDNICEEVILFLDFEKQARLLNKEHGYDMMNTPIPFPYFGKNGGNIVTYVDGYVSFGKFNLMSSPPVQTDWPYSPNLFGPYWTAIDGESKVYIIDEMSRLKNATMDVPLLTYIKMELNTSFDFEPLYAKVITWKDVKPNPASDHPEDNATFQLILATDGHFSFALINYDYVWENTEVSGRPHVSVVSSGKDGKLVMGDKPKNKEKRHIQLFHDAQPSRKPYMCVETTLELKAKYGNSSHMLPACPCYKFQAEVDYQFQMNESDCFNSRLWSGDGLKQTCCYDSSGQLLVNTKMAKVPLEKTPGNFNFEVALAQCCTDAPHLCGWFYQHFMSSDCSNYNPPKIGSGFGDPHLETFDGNKYSFNGLGEYVVFKSGDVELQGRTNKTNVNTTFFTVYALKPAENVTVQVHYDETSETMKLSWMNKDLLQADDYDVEIVNKTVKLFFHSFAVQIKKLDKTEGLSHSAIVFADNFPTVGLMGSLDGEPSNDFLIEGWGDYQGEAGNLTGMEINNFGNQWRVTNETSLFSYTDPTDTSFDEVNDLDFPAASLETTPDKMLAMFDDKDKAVAQELCGDDLFCLQDFYLNKDNTSATDTKAAGQEIDMLKETLSQMPPKFTNKMDAIELNVSQDSYMLNLMVEGDSMVVFNIDSNLNITDGVSLDNETFRWNISAGLDSLRVKNYPLHLRFYARHSDQLVSLFAPPVHLCLCEDPSQCRKEWATNDDVLGDVNGNVKSLACECGERATGAYCEQQVDLCQNCYNKTLCNDTKVDYCAPCPDGYHGDGKLCRDIDECATANGGCEQICTNHPGSFECECEAGYRPHENSTEKCDDVDECSTVNYCNNTLMQCINGPGSVICSCYPGLYGPNCIQAPYVYMGSVVIISITGQEWSFKLTEAESPEFKALASKVENSVLMALENKRLGNNETLLVSVMSFEIEPETTPARRKRASDDTPINFRAAYTIRSTKSLKEDDIVEAFREELSPDDCTASCSFGELSLIRDSPMLQTDVDLCSFKGSLNLCDQETQICSHSDNRVYCKCKEGFEVNPWFAYSCNDIDECATNTSKCAASTYCTNEHGTYSCTCEEGLEWNAEEMSCTADKCNPNPCTHDGICTVASNTQGFVCECEYDRTGDICEDEDTDVRRWKIAVICISVILGFLCLCLLIIVIVLCCRNRKTLESHTYTSKRYGDFEGLPRPKVKSEYRDSREMAENGKGNNTYDSLNNANDNHNYTSFGRHAQSSDNEEGNKQVYMNRAYNETEVGERSAEAARLKDTQMYDYKF